MYTTIRRWGLALLGVATGWLATLALVMVLSDAAPGAIAVLPRGDFVSRLPEDAAVVGGGPAWVAVRADIEGLGELVKRRVYEHSGVLLEWEIQRVGRP